MQKQTILNLGILAHVDAGKTTLTERLLYHAGVIREVGSVDAGTTQTDTLALERQRGITITSAIVAFRIGDLAVNLIDTPGHPDFIAEVERALGVLDGVVLVVSSVEGVQAQTRRLAAAIRATGRPLVIVANKIDRRGAREHDLLAEIEAALALRLVPLNTVTDIGAPEAGVVGLCSDDPPVAASRLDLLTATSDAFLRRCIEREVVPPSMLDRELIAQAHRRLVTPVVFASARTGTGMDAVFDAIARYLPPSSGRDDDPLHGTVFKIQRDRGERVVLARLFSGTVAPRRTISVGRTVPGGETERYEARIVAVDGYSDGQHYRVECAGAGEIVRLHGLRDTRIGDVLGESPPGHREALFPPPVLESVIAPVDPARRTDLYAALTDLADQDPLIAIRRIAREHAISVALYGDVQKEVIAATLENEHGVAVTFAESSVICVETPIGTGEALEEMATPTNPFLATVGLRVAPGAPGSGITYHRELGMVPLAHYAATEETVRAVLEEGLLGWPVIDIDVTLTRIEKCPITSPGDYRHAVPMVLMDALRRAGTEVREPVERFTLTVPDATLGEVLGAVAANHGSADGPEPTGAGWQVTGLMPTACLPTFERKVTSITSGQGTLTTRFARHEPVRGEPPRRERSGFDPLDRPVYLAAIAQGLT